jgi:uncharacterized repeat protein (TIGR01451 family)
MFKKVVCGLLAVTAIALAAPAAEAQRPPFVPDVPYEVVDLDDLDGAQGGVRDARTERLLTGKTGGNVAVFVYQRPGSNALHGVAMPSIFPLAHVPPGFTKGHAEQRIMQFLEQSGVKREWVKFIYSELEPCDLAPNRCRRILTRENFPALERIYYSLKYGNKAERQAAAATLREFNDRALKEAAKANGIMNHKAEVKRGGGALPFELAKRVVGRPGGIDFSTLELRHVADTRGGLRYSFRGELATGASDPAVGQQTARQASDAFFTWLAVPPQSHWVNLNPNEPDRIFDAQFGRTEAGKVLLEADLAMKKSFARAMHPDTPSGAAFWQEFDALYDNRPDGNYCFSFRQEIVPAPASVRESGGELFILDAPLRIEAVAQHYPGYTPCSQQEALDPRKQELYRRVIVPVVEQAINTEPQYAALRRVYLSRVAAEWFRRRSAQHTTAVSGIVDSGNVDPWALDPPWDPQPVFDEMVRSLTHGEFVVERPKQTGGVDWIRVYAFGGVNFSAAPRRKLSAREFKTNYPKLSRQVKRARRERAATDTEVWLGGGGDVAQADVVLARPDLLLNVATRNARAQAGQLVTYRLRAANTTSGPLRGVRVCDRMPAALRYVRSSRPQQVRNGNHCWRIARIGAGRSTTIVVTAQLLSSARGRVPYQATASAAAASVAGSTGQQSIRVRPASSQSRPGGVTG